MRFLRLKVLLRPASIAIALSWATAVFLPQLGVTQETDEEEHSTGYIPTPEHEYLAEPAVPLYRDYLPARVDLAPHYPPPGDQGDQGSCVSWAVGYAARSYLARRDAGSSLKNESGIVSPAFIHNLSRTWLRRKHGMSGCDGNRFLTSFKIMRDFGSVGWNEMPYDDKSCQRMPPKSRLNELARTRPRPFGVSNWQRLERIDDIKGRLAKSEAVVAAIKVPKSFHRFRSDSSGKVYRRGPRESVGKGGHAIAIVGYDESKRALKLMNSWGRDWGQDGFMWMDYGTFRSLKREAWVVYSNGSGVRPNPKPKPKPVPAPRSDVTARLQRLFNTYDCANLRAVSASGVVTVSGYLKSESDLTSLQQKAQEIANGETLHFSVNLRPWPQCEVLKTLTAALRKPRGLSVAAAGQRQDVTLSAGDVLSIEATSPDFPSYLYLSYIQQDGSVVHLVQPGHTLETPKGPQERFIFGDGKEGRARFRVSPPFGNELVIAVASASPLFSEPRPGTDLDRDYLTALRQALLQRTRALSDRKIVAAIMAVKTEPGGATQ